MSDTFSNRIFGQTLLNLDHISMSYDGKPVLREISAEIKEIKRDGGRGQITGILGPSGCGKTTLFRIIAGLEKPTSGTIVLDGGQEVHPGKVGVVSQNYSLFWHRTVFSNLMLAAKYKDPKTAKDRVMSYLEQFGLTDKVSSYPIQLSGGQRQRIAILQQILCSSHYLLMDEPFSGLDLIALEKVSKLIQEVANLDEANALIIVSHDITTICSVSDHIWLLGRERDTSGNFLPGTRIVEQYNLVERDLCWHPEIITSPRFMDFTREVKERFRTL